MSTTLAPLAHFANEDDYADLDYEGAVARLAAALAIPTVSGGDEAPFRALHELIRTSWPHVAELGSFQTIGCSLLVEVTGTEPELPGVLLLAHLDVVPVAPETLGAWDHPPFSGYVDDTWIWGRGALDIKELLVGELEALDYLLAHHGRLRRTVWLAFGEDEETESRGARAIAAELARRGARAAVSLDEGVSTFLDGADFGAPGMVFTDVCLSQKGYLDLRVSAPGTPGHSSNPFGGTSLEHVCRAVAALADAMPRPQLVDVVRELFRTLAPYVSDQALRALVADVDANADRIAELAAGRRALAPLVTTTLAVDQVTGSSTAPNVMPADASATMNLRLLPGTTAEDVLEIARRATEGMGVSWEIVHATPAGRLDETTAWGYRQLEEALARFHPDVPVVPSIVCGGTDSVRYEGVCDLLLRVTPFRPPADELARGVHGVNERISRRVFAQGLRVLVSFLQRVAL